MKTLQRLHSAKLDLIVGIVIAVIGLKMASVSSGPYHIQNDGYNVTGAFLALIGGMAIGSYAAQKAKKK